jgi:hypothetical protein
LVKEILRRCAPPKKLSLRGALHQTLFVVASWPEQSSGQRSNPFTSSMWLVRDCFVGLGDLRSQPSSQRQFPTDRNALCAVELLRMTDGEEEILRSSRSLRTCPECNAGGPMMGPWVLTPPRPGSGSSPRAGRCSPRPGWSAARRSGRAAGRLFRTPGSWRRLSSAFPAR